MWLPFLSAVGLGPEGGLRKRAAPVSGLCSTSSRVPGTEAMADAGPACCGHPVASPLGASPKTLPGHAAILLPLGWVCAPGRSHMMGTGGYGRCWPEPRPFSVSPPG